MLYNFGIKKIFKMKVLKTVAIILGVLIGTFVIYNASIDPHYEVDRTIDIASSPAEVSAVVSDFKTWPNWSTWFERDSTMTASFTDNTSGIGASYSWTSEHSGSGSMEILAYAAEEKMTTSIVFDGMGASTGNWTFEATDSGTKVTWGFSGEMPFFFRFMAPNMEQAVAPDFEAGLKNLKELIEQG